MAALLNPSLHLVKAEGLSQRSSRQTVDCDGPDDHQERRRQQFIPPAETERDQGSREVRRGGGSDDPSGVHRTDEYPLVPCQLGAHGRHHCDDRRTNRTRTTTSSKVGHNTPQRGALVTLAEIEMKSTPMTRWTIVMRKGLPSGTMTPRKLARTTPW